MVDRDATAAATAPRVRPLRPKEWPPEMTAALNALRPTSARHPRTLQGDGRPTALNALGTLALHPALTQAFHSFTGHVLFNTTLSVRQRELVVLRIAAVRGSQYEWAQHVVLGLDAGLDREEITSIAAPVITNRWSRLEHAMLEAVDELIRDANIGDATWQVLAAELDEQQLMDLIFTVGAYDTLAMLFRSFGIEIDDDLRAWHARYDAGKTT